MLGLVPQDSQQEMMWELMGYCRNDFIAEAIRQDTLEAVTANLYIADNELADHNKFSRKCTLTSPNLT